MEGQDQTSWIDTGDESWVWQVGAALAIRTLARLCHLAIRQGPSGLPSYSGSGSAVECVGCRSAMAMFPKLTDPATVRDGWADLRDDDAGHHHQRGEV